MFSTEKIDALLESKTYPAISIYLPTSRAGQVAEDRIRLKNQLQRAEEKLEALGFNRRAFDPWLKPAHELVEDDEFLNHLSDGLALYIAPDFFQVEEAPIDFEEQVMVGREFYLKPILGLLDRDDRFFILALSQKDVRFFEGHHYSIIPVIIHDLVPQSLKEATRVDERINTLQYHTSAGRNQATYHGHERSDDHLIEDFLRQVNDGLMEMLHDEKPPLVLAGTEELVGIYRQVNTYPFLYEHYVHGNPDAWDPVLLQEKAWEVIQPHFERQLERQKDLYKEAVAMERGSLQLSELLPAAQNGRLDVLFLQKDAQNPGAYDAEKQRLDHEPEDPDQAWDLLDRLAKFAYRNKAKIYNLPADHMPDASDVKACGVYRY